ncbi:MAG: hypothetical protein ACUVUC_15780 [Thermoguttaceae bacterium]
MWRAFFLGFGIYVFLLGAQCLAVERFILKARLPARASNTLLAEGEPKPGPRRELVPKEYAPWILMSTGAVVCGYSFTLPRRWNGK